MWIIAAWEGILQEVCVKGFGECCIYTEMVRLIWYGEEWEWRGWEH